MNRWSHILFSNARRTGKTYQLTLACKAIDGTLICLNAQTAKDVAREYGIKTLSVQNHPDHLRGGTLGPIFFDTEAVGAMAANYERRIEAMEAKIRELEAERHSPEGEEP